MKLLEEFIENWQHNQESHITTPMAQGRLHNINTSRYLYKVMPKHESALLQILMMKVLYKYKNEMRT
jgi:hypothetical protein